MPARARTRALALCQHALAAPAQTTRRRAIDALARMFGTLGAIDARVVGKVRAEVRGRLGDKDKVVRALEEALEKTSGAGSKIDLVLTLVRIAFFYGDFGMIEKELKRSDECVARVRWCGGVLTPIADSSKRAVTGTASIV